MKEISIDRWDSFVKYAGELDVGDPSVTSNMYRGHADSTWKLEPTLHRSVNPKGTTEGQLLKLETRALDEFRAQAHQHLHPNLFAKTASDTFSWWTLMQHYGAPTRLLDWTESLYVAAYFAVVEHPETDGCIWMADIVALHSEMREKYGSEACLDDEGDFNEEFLQAGAPHVLQLVHQKYKPNRVSAQQAGFTVCRNVRGNHDEILSTLPDTEQGPNFVKLIIPAGSKRTFVRKLRTMNITANSLFPGLDGLGRSVRELLLVATQ